jgi:hypothetical protein
MPLVTPDSLLEKDQADTSIGSKFTQRVSNVTALREKIKMPDEPFFYRLESVSFM